MILSTHAIVGGAIASLIPGHPVLVAVAGFASHFAIDAIPHWDYPLRSISVGKNADNRRLQLSRGALADLLLIGTDAGIGFGLSIWLFATPATVWTICLGAIAAMLPDPLQFVHSLYPYGPLDTLQRFHEWIHTKRKLAWRLGVSSQIAFASAVTALAVALN
jgi:type IV secretory pathway TrbD component